MATTKKHYLKGRRRQRHEALEATHRLGISAVEDKIRKG